MDNPIIEKESSQVPEEQGNVWEKENYGGNAYERVTEFQLKRLLDKELASKISDKLPVEDGVFVEFGCGRGPVSKLLLEENNALKCIGIEKNPNMTNREDLTEDGFVIENVDMTDFMGLPDSLRAVADAATLENAWYATTVPSDGSRRYTEEEALFLRRTALVNVAYSLKPGGTLVISDPLEGARDLGFAGTIDFVRKELIARRSAGFTGSNALKTLLQEIFDPRNKEVRKYNQKITQEAHLFKNVQEIDDFIKSTGLFEIVESKDGDYLGHNALVVVKRTEKPVEKVIKNPNWQGVPQITGSTIIPTDHPEMGKMIGAYRIYGYTEGNVNPALPIQDEFDKRPDGRTIVLFGDSPNPLAVVSLNIYKPEDNNLEMGSIMESTESTNSIGDLIIKKIETKEDYSIERIVELRRFSTCVVGSVGVTPNEMAQFMKNAMPTLAEELKNVAEQEDLTAGLFITDPIRMRLFNYGLKNSDFQFKELEGFQLDRRSVENQTLLISGADYFLGQWQKDLSEDKRKLIDQLRAEIFEKDGSDWRRTIEKSSSIVDKELCIETVEEVLKTVPDNVKMYYTVWKRDKV